MAKVTLELEGDASNLQNQLSATVNGLNQVSQKSKELNEVQKKTFQEGANAAVKAGDALKTSLKNSTDDYITAWRKRKEELKKEQAELDRLRDKVKRSFDAETIRAFNVLIKASEERIKLLGGQVEKASVSMKKLKSETQQTGTFFASFKNLAGSLGLLSLIGNLGSAAREAFNLAKESLGVIKAFERLNKPNLLGELRKATRGSVTDINLMKAAINASNFQIPLNTLGTLFKFASQRARETGQSVDYLVDSLVNGIARKSPLILDNLGINIQRIQKEFKKTGDFAEAATKIINEELEKQGEFLDSDADKIDRLSAGFERFKLVVGELLLDTSIGLINFFSEAGELALKFGLSVSEAAVNLGILKAGVKELDINELNTDQLTKFINDTRTAVKESRAIGLEFNDTFSKLQTAQETLFKKQNDNLGINKLKEQIGLLDKFIESRAKAPVRLPTEEEASSLFPEDFEITEEKKLEILKGLLKAKQDLIKKDVEEDEKAREERLKKEKEFQKLLDDIRKKVIQAETSNLSGTERIKAEFENNRTLIDNLKKTLIDKGKELDKNFKLTRAQEELFRRLSLANEEEYQKKLTDLSNKGIADRVKAEQEAEADAIKEAGRFVDENLDLLRTKNKAAILITKEGTNARIQAEIDALLKEREFLQQNFEQTPAIIADIAEIDARITGLKAKFNTGVNVKLAELLGLSEADFNIIKSQLQSVMDSVVDIIEIELDSEQRLLDKRKELNDELIRDNEDRVDELEGQLDRELELAEKGFANNVDLVHAQLDEAIRAKREALEEEKRIKKEQDELARKQLLVEAAQQASSLISAGATLFAKGAFTGPVGIAIAAATVAAMVASFVALKAKIREATAPGFYEGGYTGDGNEREEAGVVHKREFVSTAQTTKKHRPLLEALHSEDFSKLKFFDIKPILEGTGVMLPDVEKINNSIQSPTIINNIKSEESKRILSKVYKELVKMNESDSKKPVKTVLPDGTIVEKTGNTTRKIRRKNG